MSPRTFGRSVKSTERKKKKGNTHTAENSHGIVDMDQNTSHLAVLVKFMILLLNLGPSAVTLFELVCYVHQRQVGDTLQTNPKFEAQNVIGSKLLPLPILKIFV